MTFARIKDLPETHKCSICSTEKPIAEMILIHRKKTGSYLLRSRCKECHNKRERGHRRGWKRDYQRRWRALNPGTTESYWRISTVIKREEINAYARTRFLADHDAILIQGRLRRRLDLHVSIDEARALLKKYGRCYPTRHGLTPKGLRECERIRSAYRRVGIKPSLPEIRIMLYEDGFHIKPKRQPIIYVHASNTLRRYHQERRNAA